MVVHGYTLSVFNTNLKKRQSQLRAGFIMFEVACALVLVGMFSFFLLGWHATLVHTQHRIAQRAHALTLACNSIEQYRATGIWPKQDIQDTQEYKLQELTITKEYRPDTRVQKFGWIIVKVAWKERGIARGIELYTGVPSKG